MIFLKGHPSQIVFCGFVYYYIYLNHFSCFGKSLRDDINFYFISKALCFYSLVRVGRFFLCQKTTLILFPWFAFWSLCLGLYIHKFTKALAFFSQYYCDLLCFFFAKEFKCLYIRLWCKKTFRTEKRMN